ncbi:MAG: pilus assembly PilX N-terminal domain-containing protein [Candidatus Kerfeldbacteria bacterium]|nr:pilus assembly PilX N-terminal domain-containing protein [Candidatus Kerfeldbacteria bacterium]
MINRRTTQPQGIVLVYVLLITFLITAIAITVSVVIINELKLTTTAADSVLAYYAAESGIERGLHTLKRMRINGSNTLADAVTAIQGLSASLSNNTNYDNAGSSQQSSVIQNQLVYENQFVQADYYDFENSLTLDLNSVAESIVVTNGGADPSTWAEVSWIAWDEQGTLGESVAARKLIGPTDLANGWTINELDVFDDPLNNIVPRGYRVRIKALFGNLSRVSVIPYDEPNGAGNVVDLPSLIQIKSVGERSALKQSLTATVPWKIPLYGLYDYVLFSEGELLKTIILSNPTYSSGPIHVEESLGAGVSCGDCATCQAAGWLASACHSTTNTYASCGTVSGAGGCLIKGFNNIWGFTLPIPVNVSAGDAYYVSLRMNYNCSGNPCTPAGRDLAVEISGQSVVVDDQAPGSSDVWRTCTIPEPFPIGSTTLPTTDPSRSIQITDHPFGLAEGGWSNHEAVFVDWYQLSTFKLFEDCI